MEGCYLTNNPSFLVTESWPKTAAVLGEHPSSGEDGTSADPPASFSPGAPSCPSITLPSPKCADSTSPISISYGGGGFQDLHMQRGSPTDLGMNGFNLSAMDLDPLANLFAFNSCSPPYKDCPLLKTEKGYHGHDVADVLLSLKHAVVHPGAVQGSVPSQSHLGAVNSGQISPLSPLSHYGQGMGVGFSPQTSTSFIQQTGPGNATSYSIYPQIQVASNGCSLGAQGGVYYPTDMPATPTGTPAGHVGSGANPVQHNSNGAVFPAAMSVNLSMNMTMGVAGFADQFPSAPVASSATPQMQWTTAGTASTPMHHYGSPTPSSGQPPTYVQPLQMAYTTPSPVYNNPGPAGGTYTFTAEFRPAETTVTLPPLEREFGSSTTFKPIVAATYHIGGKQPETLQNQHILSTSGSPKAPLKFRSPTASLTMTQTLPAGFHNPATLSPADIEASMSIGGKTNLCRICGKTYARPSTLKTHMRTHSGERPYRCNTCSKSFSQAANLTAHIRTHSGEKPFRCPVCDRRFSQSSSVTTHMRTHSGERPYRCCMCKKAFSDSSTLTKHLRIHSGEKPYQCKLCLLRFSQSGNLNRHMRVHTTVA